MHPRFLDLANGQRLAWDEYGAPDGEPVIYCHGWPGARRQAERLSGAASALNLRLISFDRPGIALSSRPAQRRLLDWPTMLTEAVDQLGLETFRIVGVSGGGPYALVSAWALPERVLAAATVCGAPPISEMDDAGALMPVYRVLLALHRQAPEAARWFFRGARPFARVPLPRRLWPLTLKIFGPADASALADEKLYESCYESFRDAWLGSADGVFEDAQIYGNPWGFAVEEIRVPVQIWHGREDRNFAWPVAEALAARIDGAQLQIVDDEGHYSLPFRQAEPILQTLRDAAPVAR